MLPQKYIARVPFARRENRRQHGSLHGCLSPLRRAAACWAAIAVLAMASPCAVCGAAEIRVKAHCACTTRIVRLGDLADVLSLDDAEADQLATLPLFPAPNVGQVMQITSQEIRELVAGRAEAAGRHRWSGAAQIQITGPEQPRLERAPRAARPVTARRDPPRDYATGLVERWIEAHLANESGWPKLFDVQLQLTAAQAAAVEQYPQDWLVHGGQAPWSGEQSFTLALVDTEQGQEFTVEARVSHPPLVVTTKHALAKGARVTAADVVLEPIRSAQTVAECCTQLDQVVGKMATRNLPQGQALTSEMLQTQLLVRRGEVVTVTARNAGVVVRTTGKAKENGGLGDLIEIETLDRDKEFFLAEVNGYKQVELSVQSTPRGE